MNYDLCRLKLASCLSFYHVIWTEGYISNKNFSIVHWKLGCCLGVYVNPLYSVLFCIFKSMDGRIYASSLHLIKWLLGFSWIAVSVCSTSPYPVLLTVRFMLSFYKKPFLNLMSFFRGHPAYDAHVEAKQKTSAASHTWEDHSICSSSSKGNG